MQHDSYRLQKWNVQTSYLLRNECNVEPLEIGIVTEPLLIPTHVEIYCERSMQIYIAALDAVLCIGGDQYRLRSGVPGLLKFCQWEPRPGQIIMQCLGFVVVNSTGVRLHTALAQAAWTQYADYLINCMKSIDPVEINELEVLL